VYVPSLEPVIDRPETVLAAVGSIPVAVHLFFAVALIRGFRFLVSDLIGIDLIGIDLIGIDLIGIDSSS